MHFGDLIHNLSRKSRIPTDSKELIALLSDKRLSEIEVPATIAEAIETNLITEEAAEARLQPKFKTHFFGQALSVADAALMEGALENGLTQEQLKDLIKDKSTPTNIKTVLKAISDLKGKSTKGNSEEVERKYAELNQKLSDTLKANAQKEAELTAKYENEINDLMLVNHLSSYNYDDRLDKETNIEVAKLKLSKKTC